MVYMNAGDWIENLSALECEGDQWQIAYYSKMNMEEVTDHTGDLEEENGGENILQHIPKINGSHRDPLTFGNENHSGDLKFI